MTTKSNANGYVAAVKGAVRDYGEAWGGVVSGFGLSGAIVGVTNFFNPVVETIRTTVQSGDVIAVASVPSRNVHVTGVGWDFFNKTVDAAYVYVSEGGSQSPLAVLAPGKSATLDGIRLSMGKIQDPAFYLNGGNNVSVLTAHAHITIQNLQNLGLNVAAAGTAIVAIGALLIAASRHMKVDESEVQHPAKGSRGGCSAFL